jgi:hypothetical protein
MDFDPAFQRHRGSIIREVKNLVTGKVKNYFAKNHHGLLLKKILTQKDTETTHVHLNATVAECRRVLVFTDPEVLKQTPHDSSFYLFDHLTTTPKDKSILII